MDWGEDDSQVDRLLQGSQVNRLLQGDEWGDDDSQVDRLLQDSQVDRLVQDAIDDEDENMAEEQYDSQIYASAVVDEDWLRFMEDETGDGFLNDHLDDEILLHDFLDNDDDSILHHMMDDWDEMEGGAQPEVPFEIVQLRQRRIARFNVIGNDYKVRIPPLEAGIGFDNILRLLATVFERMLDTLMENVAPHDRVRITIQSGSLDFEIWMPFVYPAELTVERILQEVEKVAQSNDKFLLEGDFFVNFIHAPLPAGNGYSTKTLNIEQDLLKRKCIIQINSTKNCCARAIVVGRARLNKSKNYESLRKGTYVQTVEAKALHEEAGIPWNVKSCGVDEWRKFQSVLNPNIQLIVVSRDHLNQVVYQGRPRDEQIILYHYENHFSLITSMTAFLRRSYFCKYCLKGYQNKSAHRCVMKCSACHKNNPCEETEKIKCNECSRWFFSQECLAHHSGLGTCERLYICQCGVLITSKQNKKQHRCGFKHCKWCNSTEPIDHLCYMQPIKNKSKKEKNEETRYIIYDFEAKMGENGLHIPHLCVAHLVCSSCFHLPMDKQCEKCTREQKIFRGDDTVSDLCDWLFNGTHKNCICIAHNAQSYDLYHILPEIHKNGAQPEIIQNGLKIMSLKVCSVTFIDSLNFLPMALDKLPKAFELHEMKKGYFPHLFSTEENQNYSGILPSAHYYDPDGMHASKRKDFEKWHEEHKNDVFVYQDELLKYCISDVDILQRACASFRQIFHDQCKVDPFKESITIASACNLVFRKNFLKSNKIALIPPNAYGVNDNQSAIALTWIHFQSLNNGQHIFHAANGGEKTLYGYKVDGLHVESKTVYEFMGCFYHGCPKCYSDRDLVNPVNELTMKMLFERTNDKMEYLQSKGYTVITEWECNFRPLLQNTQYKDVYETYKSWNPLQPRDAFFGGRTNAIYLHKDIEANEKIKYVDYTSLYPWVCKHGKFPIGHPKVYHKGSPNMPTDINKIEGLVKITILPPPDLFHPLLPYRCNNKLTFPLCRTCVESMSKTKCTHSIEERAIIGTWVSLEIQKAVQLGYRILDIHSVWDFEEVSQLDNNSNGLFGDYIDCFLKLKIEASGYPLWVKSDEDKAKYVEECFQKDGITVDPHNISNNSGLRNLAKLCLNSFWGKFGQQPNKDRWIYMSDVPEYIQMMTDDSKIIKHLTYVNENCIGIKWQYKEEFAEMSGNTNIAIACYTTAQARLRLYTLLEKLNERVLYFDTDSVVYVHKEELYNPDIEDGLGNLKDELDGDYIESWIAGGPKNYAYVTNGGDTVCKIRGFTLNFRNSKTLNFQSMKNIVTEPMLKSVIIQDPFKIVRNTGMLQTRAQDKQYRFVYDKRVIGKNYKTYPYGWTGEM